MNLYWFSLGTGVVSILLATVYLKIIARFDDGTKEMIEIGKAIREGAMAFLFREYKTLAIFVLVVAGVLAIFIHYATALCFVIGAISSVLAGFLGMHAATKSNVKTASAAQKDIQSALKVAFSGGAVLGLSVVGIGLFGVVALFMLLNEFFDDNLIKVTDIIAGYGFGASSVALFARVGGGIYTKGADLGADLVGKIEANIPEDDPRNPAVIADNVGDNVGDTAGMGADLFESYVTSLIGAMVIGAIIFNDPIGAAIPFAICAFGIIATIIGILVVRPSKGDSGSHEEQTKKARQALNKGVLTSVILAAIFSFLVMYLISSQLPEAGPTWIGIFWATLAGIISGLLIGVSTEYYTSDTRKPVRDIAQSALTGPATTIISGLSVGMFSTAFPILITSAALFVAYKTAGLYGIPMAAVGLQATIGIILAMDGYGPIADNAAGIAEMAGLGRKTRELAEALDSVGNTTAAIGKGFAISSAAFSAFAMFWAYTKIVKLETISLNSPLVLIGLFVGGLLPVIFCALTLGAVGKAGFEMVNEVRRQFREIKGIMEGTTKPDYKKCVDISTRRALAEMMPPGILAVVAPIIVGFILGIEALGGMLAGSIVVAFLLAVLMSNSGGAWDNAKKYIEADHLGGKGSDAHHAAVVGDTVGDPFKDTSGPSLNILIKLMSIIAMIFAPLFLKFQLL
ncbi:sodium-translocating pyrophosphatase [candidate division KSB1 bacterium RBG_16_48_16]|nr:MAG: sodium-translocating pyrophosphatase [candidate division KSB1 bacterium RBG_16_48_16]